MSRSFSKKDGAREPLKGSFSQKKEDSAVRRKVFNVSLRKESRANALTKKRRVVKNITPVASLSSSSKKAEPISSSSSSQAQASSTKENEKVKDAKQWKINIVSGDAKKQHAAIECIRDDLPGKEVIASGVVPILIISANGMCPNQQAGTTKLIADPMLRVEVQIVALWALTNIISEGTEHTHHFLTMKDGLDTLLRIVRQVIPDSKVAGVEYVNKMIELRAQAVWALTNIAEDKNPEFRDLLISHSVHNLVLPLFKIPTTQVEIDLLTNLCHLLYTFFRKYKPYTSTIAISGQVQGRFGCVPMNILGPLLPYLVNVMKWVVPEGEQAVYYACNALRDITDDRHNSDEAEKKCFEAIISLGALPLLKNYSKHSNTDIAYMATSTITNLLSASDDGVTQVVIDANIIPLMLELQKSPIEKIAREATRGLGNISAGNDHQRAQLLATPNIEEAIENILRHKFQTARVEGAHIVCNVAALGTADQIKRMMRPIVVYALCVMLTFNNDPQAILVAIETLQHLLRVSTIDQKKNTPHNTDKELCAVAKLMDKSDGILKLLEFLQSHELEEISDKAESILKNYFFLDETDIYCRELYKDDDDDKSP